MLKIGITGGIGTGKTTVCRIFASCGAPVFDADNTAKQIMNTDPELISQIKETFGKEAYLPNGELDRKYLAGKVFNDAEALAKLNALVHPAAIQAFIDWAALQDAAYIVKEAAILFESGSHRDCDFTILVTADEPVRIARVMQRDAVDEESVRYRMSKQMPEEEKKQLADFVIDNNGTQALLPQVLKLHRQFLEMASADE